MKKRIVRNLALWLAILSLACGPVLAAYAPGTDAPKAEPARETAEPVPAAAEELAPEETAEPAAKAKEPAPETEKPTPETERPASPETDEETADLLDAAGNVYLQPYYVNEVRQGYFVTGCPPEVTAAVIPAEYEGLPVVHVGEAAFKDHQNLVSVVIPDSVKTIGAEAFYNCYKLSGLTLPASVSFLGHNNYCCRDIERLSVRFTAGSGVMPDYTTDGSTAANYYSWTPWHNASWYGKETTVEIDDGVTNVGAYAFNTCDDIKSVSAGKDLTAVGNCAFQGCGGMEAAPFIAQLDSLGAGAFQGCKSIPAAVVKEGVTVIPESAFNDCQALATVVLPDSVTSIGPAAFYNCYSLSSLTLPASASFLGHNNYCCRDIEGLSVHITKGTGTMPNYSTAGDAAANYYSWTPWHNASWYGKETTVEIDDGVNNVGAWAFNTCDDIKSVTAGKDLSAVGEGAFQGCGAMEAAPFIAQLDSLGAGAFQGCKSIPKAVVKEGVTTIPESAFNDCEKLATVVLPDSVTSIGSAAFYNCYSLSSLTLPASATFLGHNNYCCRDIAGLSVHITKGTGTMPNYNDSGDATINHYSWTPWHNASWYAKPTTVVIDDGVKNAGAYVFYTCDDITSVTAGGDLSAVGDHAFHNCAAMEAAPFIAQLDRIGESAFQNCKTIPEAVVKPGVTMLPESAFSGCEKLKTVVLPDSLAAIGPYAFYSCYSLSSFTLPASAVFQGNNDYCCRDIESLSVRFTKGTGAMPDYTTVSNIGVNYYGWTPWHNASWYAKPTTVVIDSGVANVGAFAFFTCDDIQSVTAGESLSAVGDHAFHGCAAMEAAPFIAQLDSLGVGAFQDCKTIPEAIVKPGVAAIPESAFYGCEKLKTVVLPDSLAAIGPYAFYSCYSLSSFTLPASAVFQGSNDYCCRDIESLSVRFTKGSGPMSDYTTDGDAKANRFSWAPWYSASWYAKPTAVVLDEGVTTIGAFAFYGADDIASLSIPLSLTTVALSATHDCNGLKTVNYSGTSDQWARIVILEDNAPLVRADKVYDTPASAQSTPVTVLDTSGKVLASAAFADLPACTVVCTLYDGKGQTLSGELKPSANPSFTAVTGAVRARILFLSGDGLVPVRAAETLWLQAA